MARESGGRGYGLLGTMLLIMAWNAAAWKYAVENYLGVTSPDYIKGRYHSAIDNFGLPLYSGTMMGSVVYREENRRGCNTYNTAFDSWPGGLPTIVLLDRGGLDSKKIEKCMGDPNADTQNPILEVEQDAQVEHGSRGAITISPTLVINDRQYRGKLDKGHVMQEICSGYKETIQPAICLNDDMKTDECLLNNGGCWEDKKTNITACKDTFRGRVCKCPLVNGVQFKGDGYTHCDGSNLEFQELSSGVVDKKDGSELWIRKMVRAVSRLEIDFSWRKLYI